MKKHLFPGIVIILLVIGVHFVAQEFSLYYTFWWFDWAMHILGGVGLGLIGYGLFSGGTKKVIVFVTILAILWEIFERIGYQFAPLWIAFGGTGDTIMDIACAILGTSFIILTNEKN